MSDNQTILRQIIIVLIGFMIYIGLEVTLPSPPGTSELKTELDTASSDIPFVFSNSRTEDIENRADENIQSAETSVEMDTKTNIATSTVATTSPSFGINSEQFSTTADGVVIVADENLVAETPIAPATVEIPTYIPEEIPETTPETTQIIETVEPLPIFEQIFSILEPTMELPEAAVMRISCTNQAGLMITTAAGSGVVVDPDGIILTNAHVAYPFTLTNIPGFNYSCIVNQTTIPTVGYTAEIVHISQAWIRKYGDHFKNGSLPASTGENDVAVLRITGTTNPAMILPASFPYLRASIIDISEGDRVQAIGFPIASNSLFSSLNSGIVSDEGRVSGIYSFNNEDVDVIGVNSTQTAKIGSSGGAIVFDGKLAAIIVTSSGTGSDASLTALTMNHVRDTLSSVSLPFRFWNR